MWFGTRNGLNRFDGNVFKVFQNKLSDKNSIGSNSIFSLLEDRKAQLWVGTYRGIYIYNPEKENFKPFTLIPQGEVRYLKRDGHQNIWIVSDLNLYCYNERTEKVSAFKLKNDQTITIQLAANSTLWAGTSRGILRKFNPATGRFTDFELNDYSSKKITGLQEIYPIGDTSLLIGTMDKALLFNYKRGTLKDIFAGRQNLTDIHIHVIFHDVDDDNYWLGTEAGLYIFNLQNRKLSVVQKQYSNPYAITDNIVSSICQDAEGGIWIGTYFGGINYYSKQYNNFKKYFPEPDVNSLSGNIVHEITHDQYGHLWIGTEDGGLNQLDVKTAHIKHFIPDGSPRSITYRNIHGLVTDGKELWIGTYEHGIDVMDLTTEKVIRHYQADSGKNSFNSNFIVTLYKTRARDILVGTWNGLFKFNRTTNNFSALPFLNAHIQSLHEDEAGTLWISSYGSGVYYYNKTTGKTGHLISNAQKNIGLINNYVNSLFEDSHKNLWCCTEGGISEYNIQTGHITNYTVENGLPANQVFRMLEDSKGNLWISTSKGLASLSVDRKQFTNYHIANGLPTEQFNYNSSFKDTDGTMYFGTVKGMVSFNPEKFACNKFVPPVYITGIQVNNQDVVIGDRSELKRSVMYTGSITLPYDRSNISLDVAALSYIIPERNGYAYRMDDIDKNWTPLTNNRKIYYTKLPPGNYLFRVKGANNEGVWNNHETRLAITILPPFWATIWAYLLYGAIMLTITWVIFRYYHIAVSEKNKRRIEAIEINTEREIYNAKIEFFTNVAHEIRTPLTLIKMPLDKLLQKNNADNETIENLNMMKKNTARLIDLTTQLLDFRKAEANKFSLNFSKTDVNDLLDEVCSIFKPSAEQKGLIFKLEMPRIALQASVDAEALKKIFSNLLTNALKYAADNVIVKLLPFSSEDHLFHVEVRNDGYIIPAEYKEKIFEPFFRLKETEKETGTGIGLPLSRSLAQLHQGTLELKAPIDGLNIFLLSLPIHQEKAIDFGDNTGENILVDAGDSKVEDYDDSKPRILLVEDNKEILGYIQKELSSQFQVLKAYNGQEALEILQNNNIQLVISDIMMPVMDGIQLCKRMKTELPYSHIPLILLTAKNSLSSKIEGLEVGADAYIEKPFAFEHLLAQMNNLLVNRNMMKEYFARSPLTHIKGIAVSKADKDFLERLNKVIYDHITETDLDVDHLSAKMNMSRPTLYRKIKGISDLTPNELINLTRLKRGAELLAEGNYKINEVANMIGYSLPTNFSRDFQRQFGVSPSAYLCNLQK